jgi:carbamoyl-phosphate synthase large subunit
MGVDKDFGVAFAKAQLGAGQKLPLAGTIFMSLKDTDKEPAIRIAREFINAGFKIIATKGTGSYLQQRGIENTLINKVSVGRPHVVDAIMNNDIQFIINTPSGDETKKDGFQIRRAALKFKVPYTTTIAGASAICEGIKALKENSYGVQTIQEYHS